MTDEEFEYLHSQGKILDWFYYQKSKKPLWIKWQEQTENLNNELEDISEDSIIKKIMEELL